MHEKYNSAIHTKRFFSTFVSLSRNSYCVGMCGDGANDCGVSQTLLIIKILVLFIYFYLVQSRVDAKNSSYIGMTFLLQFLYYQLKSSSRMQFLNIALFNIDFLVYCWDAVFVFVRLCVCIYICVFMWWLRFFFRAIQMIVILGSN